MRSVTIPLLLLAGLLALVPVSKAAEPSSEAVLNVTGIRHGLVVHVGAYDGGLAEALAQKERVLVHALALDTKTEAHLRQQFLKAGLCGQATTGHIGADSTLPLADNVASIVVADLDGARGIQRAELLRVLRPLGKAYLASGGQWSSTTKPRPADTDDWPQYYHDAAMSDVKSFQARLGYDDRQRIEQCLASIRDVEQRLTDKGKSIEQGRPKFDEASVRLDPQGKSSMQEHIGLMMDLIALAFQTDMTRVVTHSLGGEGGPNYDDYKDWSKVTGAPLRGAHDFHHKGSGNRGADNPDTKVIGLRDAMFCASLARLMDKLKSIPAREGTLLDHTVLLLGGSQISSHSGGSFPMLLAGGRKLGFKHGQHVKWKGNTKPASDLYLTILQQMGCPVKSFKESTGPISELLT